MPPAVCPTPGVLGVVFLTFMSLDIISAHFILMQHYCQCCLYFLFDF